VKRLGCKAMRDNVVIGMPSYVAVGLVRSVEDTVPQKTS